ncbi:hypothetical protein O9992_00330 [Vibrio lentus]|nr:hypothetical protein [Vibrio lentus]
MPYFIDPSNISNQLPTGCRYDTNITGVFDHRDVSSLPNVAAQHYGSQQSWQGDAKFIEKLAFNLMLRFYTPQNTVKGTWSWFRFV